MVFDAIHADPGDRHIVDAERGRIQLAAAAAVVPQNLDEPLVLVRQ